MVWFPLSSPRRSRTFVSALSERCPQPLNDRAVCQSGWPDSNRRSRAPKARGVPLPYIPKSGQWPVRESNPSLRLERAVSFADRRTGHVVRAPGAQWVVRRSNPRLLVFSQALEPSQLPTRDLRDLAANEKARCLRDTGLWRMSPNTAAASQAQNLGGGLIRWFGESPCAQTLAYQP